jgi:hypothetical protein
MWFTLRSFRDGWSSSEILQAQMRSSISPILADGTALEENGGYGSMGDFSRPGYTNLIIFPASPIAGIQTRKLENPTVFCTS